MVMRRDGSNRWARNNNWQFNCNATVLVKLRDIEAPKEDDGFEGAFLSS